jgi:hypothetical protein
MTWILLKAKNKSHHEKSLAQHSHEVSVFLQRHDESGYSQTTRFLQIFWRDQDVVKESEGDVNSFPCTGTNLSNQGLSHEGAKDYKTKCHCCIFFKKMKETLMITAQILKRVVSTHPLYEKRHLLDARMTFQFE